MKTIKLKDFKDENLIIKKFVISTLIKIFGMSFTFLSVIAIALLQKDNINNLIAGISIFSLLFFIFIFGVYADIKGLAWYCKGLEDKQNTKERR